MALTFFTTSFAAHMWLMQFLVHIAFARGMYTKWSGPSFCTLVNDWSRN